MHTLASQQEQPFGISRVNQSDQAHGEETEEDDESFDDDVGGDEHVQRCSLKNTDTKVAARAASAQRSAAKSTKENTNHGASGASGVGRKPPQGPQKPLTTGSTNAKNAFQLRTKNSVFKNCNTAFSALDLNKVGQKIRRIEVQQGDTENMRKYQLTSSDAQPSSATRRSGVAVKKV